MLSIGEFSRVSGLSVKALRLYHDEGLLVPRVVDESSGYRYYDEGCLERARVIAALRGFEMPLEEIGALLAGADDDGDAAAFLERHRLRLEARIRELRHASVSLARMAEAERAAQAAVSAVDAVVEKRVPRLLVAGIRRPGVYTDSGQRFSELGRRMGRLVCGAPMNLMYDEEYRETDADFESCFPVKAAKTARGIEVRELPEITSLSLVYRGPYLNLGRAYARLFAEARQRKLTVAAPCREVYLKGPGMLFKGNPERYLTEVQLPVT
jgi:DNA-binding transcriptional MerR regulator/effector-binding domain-containing protein